MTTSDLEFPKDELLNCLRRGEREYGEYIQQVEKMNM